MTASGKPVARRRFHGSNEAVKALAAIRDPAQRDQHIDRFLDWLDKETDNWLDAEIKRATARPERWMRVLGGYGSIIVGLATSGALVWMVIDGYKSGQLDFVRSVLSSGVAGALLGGVGGYWLRASR